MTTIYILVLGIPYTSTYEKKSSFHIGNNIIYTSIYDSNKYSVFKKASTINILGTML
jgi:hypothetical protein